MDGKSGFPEKKWKIIPATNHCNITLEPLLNTGNENYKKTVNFDFDDLCVLIALHSFMQKVQLKQ